MDTDKLKVEPGAKFKLVKFGPGDTHGVSKSHALKAQDDHVEKLASLHDVLYAEHKRSLLIILQGMDAAGKDGTIKHVMSGVNPQGCSVTSFKQPSQRELDHDFLWRVHASVPEKGSIGIFNRSQYEDVLIVRVHKLVPPAIWEQRYDEINAFEKILTQNHVHILKFFLHLSKEEQGRRFEARLTDPSRNWKASPADFKERAYWGDYQDAYEDAISKCSTADAPWYVIPSDHKWFRNFAVAEAIIHELQSLKMQYPAADRKELGLQQGGKMPLAQ